MNTYLIDTNILIYAYNQDSELHKQAVGILHDALNKEMNAPTTTIIYGSNVAFWIFGTEIFSVLIRSETMAVTYKKYFDFLWSNSKVNFN